MTIPEEHKRELYAYIFGIVKRHNCFLIRINGIPNHIHMLVDLHPTVALATLVKDIKQWSSHWLKQNPKFPYFDSWCGGYYGFSVGLDGVESVKQYIINQEKHHLGQEFIDEMKEIAATEGVTFHPADWD